MAGSADGSSTLSFMSSSDEASALLSDEEVSVAAGATSSSVTAPKPSLASGTGGGDDSITTKDSKDTTHNVSLLPVDDDQQTEPGHSQSQKVGFFHGPIAIQSVHYSTLVNLSLGHHQNLQHRGGIRPKSSGYGHIVDHP